MDLEEAGVLHLEGIERFEIAVVAGDP